jgi:hypothetical protein
MLNTVTEGGRRPPQAYIDEAQDVMKRLRSIKPLRRSPDGQILDGWTTHRAAGLVRQGVHEYVERVVVKTAAGEKVEAAVQGTVLINNGRETLFVLADKNVMTQIFPKPDAGRM